MCASHSRGTQTYCLIRSVPSPVGQRKKRFRPAAPTEDETPLVPLASPPTRCIQLQTQSSPAIPTKVETPLPSPPPRCILLQKQSSPATPTKVETPLPSPPPRYILLQKQSSPATPTKVETPLPSPPPRCIQLQKQSSPATPTKVETPLPSPPPRCILLQKQSSPATPTKVETPLSSPPPRCILLQKQSSPATPTKVETPLASPPPRCILLQKQSSPATPTKVETPLSSPPPQCILLQKQSSPATPTKVETPLPSPPPRCILLQKQSSPATPTKVKTPLPSPPPRCIQLQKQSSPATPTKVETPLPSLPLVLVASVFDGASGPEPEAGGSRSYLTHANTAATAINAKKFSRRCDVLGCPNSRAESQDGSSAGAKIFYHKVPPNGPRRTAWLDAVPLRKAKGRISQYAQVCSLHFHPGDYVTNASLSESFGISWKIRKLSRDAVPSILPVRETSEPQLSLQQEGSSPDVASSAFQDSASSNQKNVDKTEEAGIFVARLVKVCTVPTNAVQSFGTQTEVDVSNEAATQTSIFRIGRDVSVQVCLRGRNMGVQVNLLLKDTS
ncbi:hypothetical protein V5799_030856 [Amblyomma americanum]|uniref:THAP-type domain-containing protein n=1 Tax=Amblyomma americanum TaxID=6943 RepID=A0AAQ4EM66_AMBAM